MDQSAITHEYIYYGANDNILAIQQTSDEKSAQQIENTKEEYGASRVVINEKDNMFAKDFDSYEPIKGKYSRG